MSYLLDDLVEFEKTAEDRDHKADLRLLNQLTEETQAVQRKYNQRLKRIKQMGDIGLAAGLGGFGLTLASIQGKPSKLKAKGSMVGAGLIMGSLIPLVGSEVVKYKAIKGAQSHIDSLRNNKALQAIEKEYQGQTAQEKTAASSDYYFENVNQFKRLMKEDPSLAKRQFESWDFEDSDDYEDARKWHYNQFKATPEETKIRLARKLADKADEATREKEREAMKGSHEEQIKKAKRLESIGLGTGLGGMALMGVGTSLKKLPEKYRLPVGMAGLGLGLAGTAALGRGEHTQKKSWEKYNKPYSDFNKKQSKRNQDPAYRKYLDNLTKHWEEE